jgi:hypothetical protein
MTQRKEQIDILIDVVDRLSYPYRKEARREGYCWIENKVEL